MVLFFRCTFGVKLPLLLSDRFGQRVEIEALEFINAIPIEWRLVSDTEPTTGWQESILERKCFAFHDLQRPNRAGEHGAPRSRCLARDARDRGRHARGLAPGWNVPSAACQVL